MLVRGVARVDLLVMSLDEAGIDLVLFMLTAATHLNELMLDMGVAAKCVKKRV